MISILEEIRNKLVHFLFPFVSRFYLVAYMALFLAALFTPETYLPIKIVLFCLMFLHIEINSEGTLERDYLPIQPGNSIFYHIYRFIDGVSFFFLPILPVIMLILGSQWLQNVFLGIFVIAAIIDIIGNRKYRPKKPEE